MTNDACRAAACGVRGTDVATRMVPLLTERATGKAIGAGPGFGPWAHAQGYGDELGFADGPAPHGPGYGDVSDRLEGRAYFFRAFNSFTAQAL
jgi:hypothetical protein